MSLKGEMPQHGISAEAPRFKLFVCKLVQEICTSLLPVFLKMRCNSCETKSTGSLLISPHQDSDIYSCSNFSECCCFCLTMTRPLALPSCHNAEEKTWDILPAHELD